MSFGVEVLGFYEFSFCVEVVGFYEVAVSFTCTWGFRKHLEYLGSCCQDCLLLQILCFGRCTTFCCALSVVSRILGP